MTEAGEYRFGRLRHAQLAMPPGAEDRVRALLWGNVPAPPVEEGYVPAP